MFETDDGCHRCLLQPSHRKRKVGMYSKEENELGKNEKMLNKVEFNSCPLCRMMLIISNDWYPAKEGLCSFCYQHCSFLSWMYNISLKSENSCFLVLIQALSSIPMKQKSKDILMPDCSD